MSSKIRSLVAKFSADMQSFNKDIQNATNAMKNGFGNLDLSQTNSALKGLNDSIRLSDSEFKKATAGMDNWKNNADGLRARLKYLNDVIDDQKTKLKGMNRQLELTEQKYGKDSKEANNLRIKINNQTAAIKKNELELKNVTGDLDKFGKETKDATKKSSLLGDIFKGGFFANIAANALRAVIGKLKEFVKATFTVADEINRLSLETGISTEKLQEMKYVTTILDGDLNLLAKSQAKLTRAMSEARDGVAEYKDAFDRLGWTVDDITNADGGLKDATEVMYDMLGALGDIENATERDAIALDIFGRSAQQLNPLIKAGSERMAELSEEAHKMGAVMSDEAVQALDLLHDRFEATKQTVTAFVGEALAGLIKTLSKPTVDSLTKAAQSVDELNDSFNESTLRATASADVASMYVDELKALEVQGLNTAEAHGEYATIVAKLIKVVPDLNIVIDEQTGLIKDGIETIEEHIVILQREARAMAYKEKYTEILKAQADIAWDIEESTLAQAEAAERLSAINANLDESYMLLASQLGITFEEAKAYGENLDLLSGYSQAVGVDTSELSNEILDLQIQVDDTSKEIGVYEQAILKNKEAQDLASSSAAEAAVIYENLAGETINLTAATEDAINKETEITDSFKNIEESADNLAQAYTDAKDAAKKSIESQVKLFNDLDTSVEFSIDNMINSLKGQVTHLDEYSENIKLAMEKGVDEGIVAKLSDGSEESAIILAELVKAGEEKITELNTEFAKVEDGKEDFTNTVAEMETDFVGSMDAMQDKLDETITEADKYTEMSDAGAVSAQGYIDGIESKMAALRLIAAEFANIMPNTTDAELDIHSPSKLMEKKANFTADGFISQIKKRIPDVTKVSKSFAEAMAKLDLGNSSLSAVAPAAMNAVNNSDLTSMTALPVTRNMQGGDNYSTMADTIASRVSEAIAGTRGGGSGDLIISVPVNGAELARATIRDFRQAENENPEVKGDF